MEQRTRVVIVEDDPDVCSLLTLVVSSLGDADVVGIAADVVGGTNLLAATQPEVAIIDLGLTDGSGVQLLAASPRTRKIVLSAHLDADYAELELLGADVVLTKPCPPADIIAALHQLTATRS